jgi:hypothetical protein
MTKRPAKQRAGMLEMSGCRRLLLRFGLGRLRRRHRLGSTLDRAQASGRKGVDPGALPLRVIDDRQTIAARIVGKIDAVRRPNAAHDVAFGVTKRHRSRCRGPRGGGSPLGQRIGVGRPAWRRHSWAKPVGADQIFRPDRSVRGQRRRFNRNAPDEQPARARKPLRIFRKKVGRKHVGRTRAACHNRGKQKQCQQTISLRVLVSHDGLGSRPGPKRLSHHHFAARP